MLHTLRNLMLHIIHNVDIIVQNIKCAKLNNVWQIL